MASFETISEVLLLSSSSWESDATTLASKAQQLHDNASNSNEAELETQTFQLLQNIVGNTQL